MAAGKQARSCVSCCRSEPHTGPRPHFGPSELVVWMRELREYLLVRHLSHCQVVRRGRGCVTEHYRVGSLNPVCAPYRERRAYVLRVVRERAYVLECVGVGEVVRAVYPLLYYSCRVRREPSRYRVRILYGQEVQVAAAVEVAQLC